ncbi:hypothetical protein Bhyg_16396 [Pseudolycoriella hygida]|uniref:Uncharacterized protein n=1 Tax=Pseudolycoriella hygida TaxID=35572 RepID=A0A9Q0MJ41_9DIPT|nr:hypothetical protein Bhyg_16396 [Pseudolycoriella hygida]
MASQFIYLVILILFFSRTSQTYFLTEDLETNLPDRLRDPIDENWQDKRSISNGFSDFYKKSYNSRDKESTYFDHKNNEAETKVENEVEKSDQLEKRENEPLRDNEIRQILSEFSESDRNALDSLINDESLDKRQFLKQNFENGYHLNKRNNYKVLCTGRRCERRDEHNHCPCPEKIDANRKLKFKRHSTSRENILQAKISLLKDNYKRSSEMRSLEDSAKRKYRKQDDGNTDR